jgi:TRAP-type C4-dicarboxylate transport system substrate-binding protein
MNSAKWNAIPNELRDAITRVNDSLFDGLAAGLWDSQNDPALSWAVSEKKMDTISLAPAETEKWIAAIRPVQNDFVNELSAKGLPGAQIFAVVDSLVRHFDAKP